MVSQLPAGCADILKAPGKAGAGSDLQDGRSFIYRAAGGNPALRPGAGAGIEADRGKGTCRGLGLCGIVNDGGHGADRRAARPAGRRDYRIGACTDAPARQLNGALEGVAVQAAFTPVPTGQDTPVPPSPQ